MPRVESIRSEVQKLMRSSPFRPFALVLENGERGLIGHPGNIAFEPGNEAGIGASEDFYVISAGLRMFSTFNAVSAVVVLDKGQV
jgi:hypothetical protein